MSLVNDRDLTDAQWEILDNLIPKPTPREDKTWSTVEGSTRRSERN